MPVAGPLAGKRTTTREKGAGDVVVAPPRIFRFLLACPITAQKLSVQPLGLLKSHPSPSKPTDEAGPARGGRQQRQHQAGIPVLVGRRPLRFLFLSFGATGPNSLGRQRCVPRLHGLGGQIALFGPRSGSLRPIKLTPDLLSIKCRLGRPRCAVLPMAPMPPRALRLCLPARSVGGGRKKGFAFLSIRSGFG